MKAFIRSALAIATAATAFHSFAAENPTVATAETSTGKFDITLNLTPFIVVNNFNDLTLTVDPATGASGQEDICVGGYGFPDYSISFDSLNGDATTPFLLKGTTETVPYSVQFAGNIATSAVDDVLADGSTGVGVRYTRLASATDCLATGSSDNASIFISVDASDWQDINEQSLTDTLTVVVSAN